MTRLKILLSDLGGSFWFIPALIVAGSILLAVSDDLVLPVLTNASIGR